MTAPSLQVKPELPSEVVHCVQLEALLVSCSDAAEVMYLCKHR